MTTKTINAKDLKPGDQFRSLKTSKNYTAIQHGLQGVQCSRANGTKLWLSYKNICTVNVPV